MGIFLGCPLGATACTALAAEVRPVSAFTDGGLNRKKAVSLHASRVPLRTCLLWQLLFWPSRHCYHLTLAQIGFIQMSHSHSV